MQWLVNIVNLKMANGVDIGAFNSCLAARHWTSIELNDIFNVMYLVTTTDFFGMGSMMNDNANVTWRG